MNTVSFWRTLALAGVLSAQLAQGALADQQSTATPCPNGSTTASCANDPAPQQQSRAVESRTMQEMFGGSGSYDNSWLMSPPFGG